VEVAETVIANKHKLDRAAALALARKAREIVVAKGKKVVRFDMATRPSDADLAAALLGPTGNLRAPTIKVGDTLLVGFDADEYAALLG
jgi:hypothetical protein